MNENSNAIPSRRLKLHLVFQEVGLFDPSTREEMTPDELIPNNAIEAAINAFLEANGWSVEDEK